MDNKTYYALAALVILAFIGILGVGNEVSKKMRPDITKGTVGWYKDTFGELDPSSKNDYDRWPEAFDKVAKNLGFDDWEAWRDDGNGVSGVEFKTAFDTFLTNNSTWAANHSPASDIFDAWQTSDFYTDTWFRMEYGLQNPLKWWAWKMYTKIY